MLRSSLRGRACRAGSVPSVHQTCIERRILRFRGELGTLARHVAFDVGEHCLEFGFVADRGERRVEVAAVAPGRAAPAARSASGWAAYVRRGAGMSTHPYPRAGSRAPCCGGRRSRTPGPRMPCSRASNSHRPDLVVSLDYPMTGLCCLTQHVPSPVPRATGRMACLQRQRRRQVSGAGRLSLPPARPPMPPTRPGSWRRPGRTPRRWRPRDCRRQ